MHGLINSAVQAFVTHTHGRDFWLHVTERAGIGFSDFETMLVYDDGDTHAVLAALAANLDRPLPEILEDIGTFLVSDPSMQAVRRLLRFGGVSYEEFLFSLDDLPDRVRLAVSDLVLPGLELRDHAGGQFTVICQPGLDGFGHVLMGILRAMADDYGALAVLDHKGAQGGGDVIAVSLIDRAFAAGRSFRLGAQG
jgi:hypothetical protein